MLLSGHELCHNGQVTGLIEFLLAIPINGVRSRRDRISRVALALPIWMTRQNVDVMCDVPHHLGLELGMCLYVYLHLNGKNAF